MWFIEWYNSVHSEIQYHQIERRVLGFFNDYANIHLDWLIKFRNNDEITYPVSLILFAPDFVIPKAFGMPCQEQK